MKKVILLTFGVLGLLIMTAWVISPVRPVAWTPDPDVGLSAQFLANERLYELNNTALQKQYLQDAGEGPEDIVIGDDGYLYTGYQDGRIVRVLVEEVLKVYQNENASTTDIQYEEFVNTQGRPLGLRFDAQGNLIVADALKGLISIDKQRNISVLVDEFDGNKLLLVDHLDIAKDGTIWFSDASARYDIYGFMYDFLEAISTGRLLSYKPSTGETEVRMDGLFFANGVAVGPNDEFVLINETGRAKIHRLWLKGDKAGSRDIFLEHLPGMPDNLSFKDGIFWISLITLRDPLVEGLAQNTFLRRVIGGLPKAMLNASSHYAFVIGVTSEGKVVHNLQSSKGYQSITTATEHEGHLFLGSLANSSIAVTKLP
jgi:sugar lactone lactonase YvrE